MTALNEKQVPYLVDYIDLRNKPDWFLAISPTGKVPVLRTPDKAVLFESAVINEYLDECHEPHLLPESPLERAADRMWRDYMVGLYGPASRLYSAPTVDDARAARQQVRAKLATLEDQIAGPYFRAGRFSLIDIAAGPAFMRISWALRIAPDIAVFDDLPMVESWYEALMARPSIRDSVVPDVFELVVESLKTRGSWLESRLADLQA